MKTQLFGVLRSHNGLNKVETNSSVISKGIAKSYRINLCYDTHVHMNTNRFDKWSEYYVLYCQFSLRHWEGFQNVGVTLEAGQRRLALEEGS